jgi:hypothetical protein
MAKRNVRATGGWKAPAYLRSIEWSSARWLCWITRPMSSCSCRWANPFYAATAAAAGPGARVESQSNMDVPKRVLTITKTEGATRQIEEAIKVSCWSYPRRSDQGGYDWTEHFRQIARAAASLARSAVTGEFAFLDTVCLDF